MSSKFVAPKLVIATSLKMYFDHAKSLEWARQVRAIALKSDKVVSGEVEFTVFPSYPTLLSFVELFSDSPVRVGAQNVASEEFGAYTGEVSVRTLQQVGVDYIEIGHSERRRYFGETTTDIAQKIGLTLNHGLIPLVCIGEQRKSDANDAIDVCVNFIETVTRKIDSENRRPLVFAYEPEWAIGAKHPAGIEHVRHVVSGLRVWLSERPHLSNSHIIYGGSAGPGLLAELNGAVNGLFLGRFAHEPGVLEKILTEI